MSLITVFYPILIPVLVGLEAGPGSAEELVCANNSLIEIVSPATELAEDICDSAEGALAFLDRFGLQLKRPVTIEVIDKSINSNGYIAFGSYDRQLDKIELMSFAAIMSGPSPQMYDQPFDRQQYRGAIAHELAHAVFHHNSSGVEDQLTNATQEYLAHATQLGVLSPELRQKIIESDDIGPWESGDSVSEIYMSLNPTGFAVKSYLHLTGLADPLPFITILLRNNWFYLSVP